MGFLLFNLFPSSYFKGIEGIDQLFELVFSLGDCDADIIGSGQIVVTENIGYFVDTGRHR